MGLRKQIRGKFEELYVRALAATSKGTRREKEIARDVALGRRVLPSRATLPTTYTKTNDVEASYGTGGAGYTRPATYAQVSKAFGAPASYTSFDDKITFMWIFSDGRGNTFTLYDYKATRRYDRKLPSIADFKKKRYSWNVGAGGPGGDAAAQAFIRWANSKLGGVR